MTSKVSLREVEGDDLPIFFEQQLDPEAIRMAAFPPRDRDAFMAHWAKSLGDRTVTLRTILFDGQVAGHMVSWEEPDGRNVGYWIGKEFWGKGIASAALSQFLAHLAVRPLFARTAKHNIGSLRVLQKCGFAISGEDRFYIAGDEHGEEYILTLAATDSSAT